MRRSISSLRDSSSKATRYAYLVIYFMPLLSIHFRMNLKMTFLNFLNQPMMGGKDGDDDFNLLKRLKIS